MIPHRVITPDMTPALAQTQWLAAVLGIAFAAVVGYLFGVWTRIEWGTTKAYNRGWQDHAARQYRPQQPDALHVSKQEGQ